LEPRRTVVDFGTPERNMTTATSQALVSGQLGNYNWTTRQRVGAAMGWSVARDEDLLEWARVARRGLPPNTDPSIFDGFDPRHQGGYVEFAIFPTAMNMLAEVQDVLSEIPLSGGPPRSGASMGSYQGTQYMAI